MLRRYLFSTLVMTALAVTANRASAQQPANCSTCNASMPVATGGLGSGGILGSGSFFGLSSLFSSCSTCNTGHKLFCPTYTYHQEGAPVICIGRGCPKPVCVPCNAPNWGYFQTCWTPWPWPQDYNHCPVLPPAAVVIPNLQQQAPMELTPAPRRIGL